MYTHNQSSWLLEMESFLRYKITLLEILYWAIIFCDQSLIKNGFLYKSDFCFLFQSQVMSTNIFLHR